MCYNMSKWNDRMDTPALAPRALVLCKAHKLGLSIWACILSLISILGDYIPVLSIDVSDD